jgi:hypothetical protein
MNETHYIMWYSGQDWASTTSKIGLATSPDGFSWIKYAGNPVLEPGPSGSWDAKHVYSPSIIRKGNILLMFYVGREDTSPYRNRIGLATSYIGIIGDINQDGIVGVKDFIILVKAFCSYPTHPRWNPAADLNNDNKVDFKDLVILMKNWGKTSP